MAENHPRENHKDVQDNLRLLTVNDPNRYYHMPTRRNFRSDSGDRRDQLYRRELEGVTGKDVCTYEEYDDLLHGIFDIQRPDSKGKQPRLIQVRAGIMDISGAEEFPPINSELDARERIRASIVQRQGQPAFRDALLQAYERQCAITGCTVLQILEAAHIMPYMGKPTNRVDNGLLLRSDLHTLFDLGLIWINPDFTIQTAPDLKGTEYATLQGQPLRLPKNETDRPRKKHLEYHLHKIAKQNS